MQPSPRATARVDPAGHVANNMVLAVVALFLFWPTAIGAIANATKVNGLAAQGDGEGAALAAFQARRFAMISFVLGAVFWTMFFGVTGCGPVARG
jgi:hypothetical protein